MSAYRTIIEVLRNVAPRKLNGREIHAADPAHELQVVHMALHDMQKLGGPLQRAKEGDGPFIYGLREGFDWQAWLDEKEGRMRSPREDEPKQDPPPAVRIVHSVQNRRDSAMIPVAVVASMQKAVRSAARMATSDPANTSACRTTGEGGQSAPSPAGVAKQPDIEPAPIVVRENRTTAPPPVTRAHTFHLPIPGKPSAFVSVPSDIDTDDWRMLKAILDVYIARIQGQRSGAAT